MTRLSFGQCFCFLLLVLLVQRIRESQYTQIGV